MAGEVRSLPEQRWETCSYVWCFSVRVRSFDCPSQFGQSFVSEMQYSSRKAYLFVYLLLSIVCRVAALQLGPDEGKALATKIRTCNSLETIDLSQNELSRDGDVTGVKAIADALSVSSSLNSLK